MTRRSKREIERALEELGGPDGAVAPDRELTEDEKADLRKLLDPGQGEDVDVARLQEQLAADGGSPR